MYRDDPARIIILRSDATKDLSLGFRNVGLP